MLDAPVSRRREGAIDGDALDHGRRADEAFARARPLFEAMGKTIVHVGPSGAGQVCKACNQLVVAATIEAVAEALLLAERPGVDAAKVREALLGGFAGSKILEVHGQRMLDRDVRARVPLRLHRKDARIVARPPEASTRRSRRSAPSPNSSRRCSPPAGADLDYAALVTLLEDEAGVDLRAES